MSVIFAKTKAEIPYGFDREGGAFQLATKALDGVICHARTAYIIKSPYGRQQLVARDGSMCVFHQVEQHGEFDGGEMDRVLMYRLKRLFQYRIIL